MTKVTRARRSWIDCTPVNVRASPLFLVVFASFICLLSCEKPIHPNDPEIPGQLCEPRCQRERDCDSTVDVRACATYCEHNLSPRVIYERADFVAAMTACAQGQACVPNLDRVIRGCQADVRRRLEPTVAAREFCRQRVPRSFKCGDYRWDENHCLEGHKTYSDAILRQLTDCLERPCSNYARCMLAVVGQDPYWEDEDRNAEFFQNPVPEAPRSSVSFHGKVTTESKVGIAAATVCLHGSLRAPCVRVSDSGDFSIEVAAHAELAMAVTAPGFGSRLVALTTTGKDSNGAYVLLREEVLRARYSALGAVFPNEAIGFIDGTARGPDDGLTGIEGVTMAIEPKLGQGPLYFASDSRPDPTRTTTSTWSEALFASVTPGEVTLTFGPAPVSCVPLYGGWPSPTPNSVRVPVAAGFESSVAMRCHW